MWFHERLTLGFGLRAANGKVERSRNEAFSEMQSERNAAAEPQTEAGRYCGTPQILIVTNAHFAQRNGRGREGTGATGSPWREAKRALVTALQRVAIWFGVATTLHTENWYV